MSDDKNHNPEDFPAPDENDVSREAHSSGQEEPDFESSDGLTQSPQDEGSGLSAGAHEEEEDDLVFDETLDAGDIPLEDDSDFIEEEWEDYDDEYIEAENSEGRTKKGSTFNKVVIGIAVIAGLGILYFQFATSSPEPQSTAARSDQSSRQTATTEQRTTDTGQEKSGSAVAQNTENTEESSKEGLLNNLDQIPDVEKIRQDLIAEQNKLAPGESAPLAQKKDQEDLSFAAPEEIEETGQLPMPPAIGQPEATSPPRAPGEKTEMPIDNKLLTASPDLTADQPEPKKQTEASQTGDGMKTAMPGNLQQDFKDQLAKELLNINDRLDRIMARVDDIDQRVSTIKTNEKAQQKNNNNDLVMTLQQSVAKLEQKMSELDAQTKSSSGESAAPPETQKQTRAKAPVTPAVKPSPDRNTDTRKEVQKKHAWVLKAATPQEAMISQEGKNEIISIKIGDTIEGLGRVTSIMLKNNVWTVQTTGGVIRQN